MSRYLFLCSLNYSFPILRPIQDAIRARGGEVAWFFDRPGCREYLREDEKELKTVQEVMEYHPIAVFTAGDDMYHFFPGVKVSVFHGFDIDKRPGRGDRFWIKGWFDLYCTNDTSSTEKFTELSEKHGSFKVTETGWSKLDTFRNPDGTPPVTDNPRPTVLYSSTFTKWITSTPYLFEEIERLVQQKDWDWIITFHPLMSAETVQKYKSLEKYHNVKYIDTDNNVDLLKKADVMLCDSSSIIYEFMYLDKPVVTFRNTCPGDHLLDIQEPGELEKALETAISRPDDLINKVRDKITEMHPYFDGKSSERVLDAVDDFIANSKGKLKKKKIKLDRRIKARRKLKYYKCR